MQGDDRISEQQAVALAGVSTRTLLRFGESGYLEIGLAPDGSRTFQASQILEIFGGSQTQTQNSTSTPAGTSTPSQSNVQELGETYSGSGDSTRSSTVTQRSATDMSLSTTSDRERSLETENQRLRNLLSIQEKILDTREDEIADLKNQRGWLRERVEKLEEKADRDQILLLSETQTIKKLIAMQENRTSPVRNFLTWIGVLPPSSDMTALPQQSEYGQKSPSGQGSRTIEVQSAANDQ